MINNGFGTLYISAEHTIKRRTPFCYKSFHSLFKLYFVSHHLDRIQKTSNLLYKAIGILIVDILTARLNISMPF